MVAMQVGEEAQKKWGRRCRSIGKFGMMEGQEEELLQKMENTAARNLWGPGCSAQKAWAFTCRTGRVAWGTELQWRGMDERR